MVFEELSVAVGMSSRDYERGTDQMESSTSALEKSMATLSAAATPAANKLGDVGDEAAQSGAEAMAAESTLDSLGEELTDTALGATTAANRLDEVGDEMTEAGAKAATASAGVTGLRASMFGLSGSLTTVVPAATGLAGALTAIGVASAPVITGLAGIAGGFASVAGVMGGGLLAGAVTHMEELKAAVKTAKTEVKAAIKPIGELFGPVLLQGVEALPTLAERVVSATGDLRPFRDALQEIGQTAMTAIPEATGAFVDFARQTLPIFTNVTKAILDGLAPAIRFLSGELSDLRSGFADVSGPLQRFWDRTEDLRAAVAPVVDQIQRFGKLAVIAGAKIGGRLLPVFTPLVEGLGDALKGFNDVAAALLGVGDATDETALKIRSFAGAVVAGLRGAFEKIRAIVSSALGKVEGFWNAHKSIVTETARSAYQTAKTKMDSVLGKAKTAVGTALGKIKTEWNEHGGAVKDAVRDAYTFVKNNPREALKTLATVIVPGPLGVIVDAFEENWGKVERNTRTTMEELKTTTRTAMQSVQKQMVTPLKNAESETRTNLGQMEIEYKETYSTIKDAVSRLLGGLLDVQNQHTKKVGKLWRTHLSGEDGILANARTAFNSLWNNIIKPTLDLIQKGWDMFGDEIVATARIMWDTMMTISRFGLDTLLTAINVTLDLISGDWEGAWTNIKDYLKRTWNEVTDWLKRTGRTLFGDSFDRIIQAAKDVMNSFGDWLFYNSFIKDLLNNVAGWLESTGKSLVKNAFDAIVGGIESALGDIDLSDIQDAIQNIIDKASDAIDTVKSIPNNVTTTITRTINEVVNEPDSNEDDGDSDPDGSSDVDRGNIDSGEEEIGSDQPSGGGSSPIGNVGDGGGPEGDLNNDGTVGGDYNGPGYGLAKGGLVTGPTRALIGEGNDDEFVTPRSTMLRELRDVAEKAMGTGGDSIVIEEINVDADSDMDERELVRAVRQELKRDLQRLSTR